jgi:hypothetical protein
VILDTTNGKGATGTGRSFGEKKLRGVVNRLAAGVGHFETPFHSQH